MPRKPRAPDPWAQLAENMVRLLESRRAAGGDFHPLTLKLLARLADPQVSPDQVKEAASGKAFAARVLVARKKDLEAPVALKEDLGKLADSPVLLEFLLESMCKPAAPAWPLGKLKA